MLSFQCFQHVQSFQFLLENKMLKVSHYFHQNKTGGYINWQEAASSRVNIKTFYIIALHRGNFEETVLAIN